MTHIGTTCPNEFNFEEEMDFSLQPLLNYTSVDKITQVTTTEFCPLWSQQLRNQQQLQKRNMQWMWVLVIGDLIQWFGFYNIPTSFCLLQPNVIIHQL